MRRDGVVDRSVDAADHPSVRELGEKPIHGFVESQDALFKQDHRGHRGDGFGHRRDAEDRVPLHRAAVGDGRGAEHVNVGFAAAAHDRNEAGRVAVPDVPGEDVVEARKTVNGEPRAGHGW